MQQCTSVYPRTGVDRCVYQEGHTGAHSVGFALWEIEEDK